VIGIIFIPSLLSSILDMLKKPNDVLLGQHLAAVGRFSARRFVQVVFYARVSTVRSVFSLDGDSAYDLENAGHAQTTT